MYTSISKGKTGIEELLNCHDASLMHTTNFSRPLKNKKGTFVVKPTVMMTVVSFCLDGVPLSRARIVKV